MKILRIILALLLIIPLVMLVDNFRHPEYANQYNPDHLKELLFLLVGLPIIIINFWAWSSPQIFEGLLFWRKKRMEPVPAPETENAETPAPPIHVPETRPLHLLDIARALGLIVVTPLGLFWLVGLISPQSTLMPMVIAGLAAALATAWILHFKWASRTAMLIAWFLFIFIVPGILIWPRNITVKGYITDISNQPVLQAVQLFDYTGQAHLATTDKHGYFEFANIPYGSYTLQIGKNKTQGRPGSSFEREIQQNFVVGLPFLETPTPRPQKCPTKTLAATSGTATITLGTTVPGTTPHRTAIAPTSRPGQTSVASYPIFTDSTLADGIGLGAIASSETTDWFSFLDTGEICMDYQDGETWGTVLFTIGDMTDPPRPSQDFSAYQQLAFEALGQEGGESVSIALKDNTDPDDRSETKVPVTNLSTDWQPYHYNLSLFKNADISKLYVVAEFFFENTPAESVCVRNIQFLR
jgi:hypothetical protein